MNRIKMVPGIIIGLTVIALIFFFFLKRKKPVEQAQVQFPTVTVAVDCTVPDSPIGFGYKCMWFAVKTHNGDRLAEILKLKNISECNWRAGIDKAYGGSVFITPAIDDWTLACGWGLPHGDSKDGISEVKRILHALSKEFGEAQFFCTHRVTEYHCWIKAKDGQIERLYSYLGESGENILIEGEPSPFERTIKLANTFSEEAKSEKYFEQEDIVWADEDLVMKVAEHWSIDPSQLDNRKDIPPGLGLLGER